MQARHFDVNIDSNKLSDNLVLPILGQCMMWISDLCHLLTSQAVQHLCGVMCVKRKERGNQLMATVMSVLSVTVPNIRRWVEGSLDMTDIIIEIN